MSDLKVNIAGVEFNNPIITASGTFGFGREYAEFYPLSALGGVCTKGLTNYVKLGNPYPRIAETPMGMINAVGLQNPGADAFIKNDAEWLKKQGTNVIANVAGNSIEDYCAIAEKISDVPYVDMIELNISCPNVKEGGMAFGVLPKSVEEITKNVKKYAKKPIIVKLSPNVANIKDNAKSAEAGGADAISLINTVSGMAIDWKKRRPILANVNGGLSGPCVKPIALKMVWDCYNAVKLPIIGLGGITSYEDVLEFMICGASAVEIGTANISDPMASYNIAKDLERYVTDNDIDINSLVGSLITD